MILAALVQALIAATLAGLPLFACLRLLWLHLWLHVREALARAIDLNFLLKDSLRDR